MALGAHSDTYVGTKAAIKPTPMPPKKREKYKTFNPTAGDVPIPAVDWMMLPMR
jgi:hypothetical protein